MALSYLLVNKKLAPRNLSSTSYLPINVYTVLISDMPNLCQNLYLHLDILIRIRGSVLGMQH